MTAQPPFGRAVPGNDWSVLDGVQPAEPPFVSVVVVHYEQHDDLARLLRALDAQTHPADRLEVVVVDDGSAVPPTVPPGVRLIVHEDRGFRASAARNAGVAATTGEVLCFLDADTAPEPGYVSAIIRLPALAPEAVTVGHRRHAALSALSTPAVPALPIEVSIPIELAGPAHELPEPAWLAEAYAASRDLLDADERSYRYLIGAVLACSRWFFDELGGFDETFVEYGGEDWDWAHRAWLAGAVLAHVPEAVAWHNGPDAAIRESDDPRRAHEKKTAETLALLSRITVPGATGRGLAPAVPDVVVRLPDGPPAALYRCVDTVLRLLPTAIVVVPLDAGHLFAHDSRVTTDGDTALRARTTVEASALFAVAEADLETVGSALTDASTRVGRGALAEITLDGDGESEGVSDVELTVTSSRSRARMRRWGHLDGWTTERRSTPVRPADPLADLAAHLGGWAEL
ncbi:glycosyltransferase family 2 protein [Herbiconiux liukaitaii]|uniref:glycosyltransferase family 2 protein n=1 Tax=Herbiconiux liukaitaii TaxID=3342799 RepID=UPI0035BA6C15